MQMLKEMGMDNMFQMTSMGDTKTGKGDDQKQGIGQMCQKISSMADIGKIAEVASMAEELAPLAAMAL